MGGDSPVDRVRDEKKTKFLQQFQELFHKVDLPLVEGESFKIKDVPGEHKVFELDHHGQQVVFWPVAEHEIPKDSNSLLIETYRQLVYAQKLEEVYEAGGGSRPRLVLVLEGQRLEPSDHERAADGEPPIVLWEQNVLDYYEDLRDKIGEYAKFSILGELDIRPPEADTLRAMAFKMDGLGHSATGPIEAYTFIIDPKRLLKTVYVARREVRGEAYYQRLIKKNKIRSIGNFIDDKNTIPNNIILAFGEHISDEVAFSPVDSPIGEEIEDAPELGLLEFPQDYRSLWIIDGQHRLYGFSRSDGTLPLVITVFKNLPVPEQAQMFLDINKNQTAVNANLVWDIQGELIPNSEDGMIARTVKTLAKLEPLEDRVYVPSLGLRKRGQLSLAGMCDALRRARFIREETRSGATNPWYTKDPDERVLSVADGLIAFFEEFSERLPNEWFEGERKGLATFDGGIAVTIFLLERFVERIGEDHDGPPRPEEYHRFLSALNEVLVEDYGSSKQCKKLRKNLSSQGGRNDVVKELCLKIREITKDGHFCDDLVEEWRHQFRPLEARLREVVNERMTKDYGEDWFQARAPDYIADTIAKWTKDDPEADPVTHLTLGHLKTIIGQYWKGRFEENFLAPKGADHGFETDKEFWACMNQVTRMRNRFHAHDSDDRMLPTDEKQLEINLGRLEAILGTSSDR